MRKRGRVKVVGVVQRKDTGRPEVLHGRRFRQSEELHETLLADVRLHYRDWPFTRDVKVGETTADGLLVIDGRNCWVEIDCSEHMDRKQMQEKWAGYGEVDGFILVVCRTEGRMRRLREWSAAVRESALFTTFDRLRAGRPWVDFDGKEVVIG